jgi:hypothetical protein
MTHVAGVALDRLVAIKVLPERLSDGRQFTELRGIPA